MIKFGFNTIAMLTYGLGISIPRVRQRWIGGYARPSIEFKDKPWGIDIEEKGGAMSFDDEEMEFQDEDMEFK